ncbi:MAG: MFS transporter [Pseudomonadales bacterium]|nr:MFS transporter [Pseudomonadales bacterium]
MTNKKAGAFTPLKYKTFRNIWTASVFSYFGHLILGVGVAWEMTRITDSAAMVALTQTALMLPYMLVAIIAGTVADMIDRRLIALWSLAFAILSSLSLTALAFMGITTPWMLLLFTVMIGCGVAFYSPSWQASIQEQVPNEQLPAAIGLGTVAYNVARSAGPAIGGIIVMAFGANYAFAVNSIFYVPLFITFFLWRRTHAPSRLPPERFSRAIISGLRYAQHSPLIRRSLIRTFLVCICIASGNALAPLIARDILGGEADIFGLLLGVSGIGAVSAGLTVSYLREKMDTELALKLLAVIGAIALIVVGLSRSLVLTCVGLFVVSGASILVVSSLNITVQLSTPRWVIARALSMFLTCTAGGIAIGSWIWGTVAADFSVQIAIIASAVALLATILVGLLIPIESNHDEDIEQIELSNEPNATLDLSLRSGPIALEIDYDIDPNQARDFYNMMMDVQKVRLRNGGYEWSLARDIENPALWTERYHCPTWGDYLRMRSRYTQKDLDIHNQIKSFNRIKGDTKVRRRLERPIGSVRWKAETPDIQQDTLDYTGL